MAHQKHIRNTERPHRVHVMMTKHELELLDRMVRKTALPGERPNRSRCIRQLLHNQT